MAGSARERSRPALALLVPLAVACDSLAPLPDGVCGNSVVDPGEDCDTFAPEPGTSCAAPGAPDACRFTCGVGGASPSCPTGMGCGVDGLCRAPSGRFAAPTQPVAATAEELLVGDVDGDHLADVVAVQPNELLVTYFDATLAVARSVQTPQRPPIQALPRLLDLSGDGRADLLTATAAGTLLALGSADRTLTPTASPTFTLTGLSNVRLFSLKALPGSLGDQFMAMGTDLGLSAIATIGFGTGNLFDVLPSSPDNLAGSVVVGSLDEDPILSPCDEFALAFKGAGEVLVYTPCKPDGAGGFTYNANGAPTHVRLAGGAVVERGPLLVDDNGDGHEDFLVGTSSCPGCHEVQIAYGVGDGTFHSSAKTLPKASGDDRFVLYPRIDGPLPLAVGDLNGDGVLDHVTPTRVEVSRRAGGAVTFVEQGASAGGPWTEAVIADLNHDGVPDVAAGSSRRPNVTFFNGVGDAVGTLNGFTIPTRGPVAHLAVGDFDGDLVNDLVLSELAVPTGAGSGKVSDSISVLFGQPVGAPLPPTDMGLFPGVDEIVTTRLPSMGILDAIADLVTVSVAKDGSTGVGIFFGRSDRAMRSPFVMTDARAVQQKQVTFTGSSPTRYVTGRFTSRDGPLAIAALATQTTPPPATPIGHVWLIPTDGSGGFVTLLAKDGHPLPPGIDWSKVAAGAVDLDGDGIDELVALGPSTTDARSGRLAVARSVAPPGSTKGTAARILQFDAPTAVTPRVSRDETAELDARETGRLSVADLDADGRPDVIVVATAADPAGGPTGPHAVVFWNDAASPLGAVTVVPNPAGQLVRDLALLGAGDAAPGVALLTDAGVYVVKMAGRTPTSPPHPAIAARGQRLIAAGDVDGDGVDDVVLADGAGFTVSHAVAVHP